MYTKLCYSNTSFCDRHTNLCQNNITQYLVLLFNTSVFRVCSESLSRDPNGGNAEAAEKKEGRRDTGIRKKKC